MVDCGDIFFANFRHCCVKIIINIVEYCRAAKHQLRSHNASS